MQEVTGQDARGLGSQELPPGRRRPPRRGAEADGGQDPPDRPLPHPVPQTEHLALDAPTPPARVLPSQLLHQCTHLGRDRRPTWGIGVGPFPLDQPPAPGQQGSRGHDPVQSQAPGQQPGQGGSLARAASTARSAQSGRGRATCRRKTATSWRRIRISASLAASQRARSARQPNIRTMDR